MLAANASGPRRLLYGGARDLVLGLRVALSTGAVIRCGGITVKTWKQSRFLQSYPGYDVEVLDDRRSDVQGNTRLATVRDTYEK